MKKLPKLLFALGMMAACADIAQAQQPSTIQPSTMQPSTMQPSQVQPGHMQASKTDFWRMNLWPLPFRAEDSLAVTAFFDIQRNNGWRLVNTLGTPMFDPDSNQLTDSGKAHLRWIMTNAPQHRRVVFVLKGRDAAQTAYRVESTQLAVSEIVPVGNLPPIYLTDVESAGSSGVYQTAVYRAMVSSVPAPRLTAPAAAAGAP